MAKITLNDVTSGYASTTLVNANNTLIEEEFENTLSRDGTSPNHMLANLDMNGYLILNSGNAISVSGFTWEGPWVTSQSYSIGDIVENNGTSYMCIVAHTSGTFATDLAAAKWQVFATASVPTQTGNANKFLQTDGATLSWQVPDASEVSFTAAGTGAIATTVQTAIRELFVSVKRFGAVGDGVTDDTLAINRAAKYLAGLGGGTLYYPAGTYLITRAIRLDNYDIETFTYSGTARNNIVHLGAGRDATTIKASGFWTSIFSSIKEPFVAAASVLPAPPAKVANRVVIKGMTLDCDYTTNVDGGATYGPYYATWGGTWPDGTIGVSLLPADNYQYPIYAFDVDDILVTECRIKNSWFNGIEIYNCSGVKIVNNIFEHCGDVSNYLGYYSAIEFDYTSSNILFAFNEVKNCGIGISMNATVMPSALVNVDINNNIFDTVRTGTYCDGWISRCKVTDNIITNVQNGGIEFLDSLALGTGKHPQNITITGNTIQTYNTADIAGNLAIRMQGHEFSVDDNLIIQDTSTLTNNTYGIVVQDASIVPTSGSLGGSVSDNTLTGYFKGASSSIAAIGIASDNVDVVGNRITSLGSVAQVAISLNNDKAYVSDNSIRGSWLSRPITYVAGTSPYIEDASYGSSVNVITTVDSVGTTGLRQVAFSSLTPTTLDNRSEFATSNFTVSFPGRYRIGSLVKFTSSGTAATSVWIYKNSVAVATSVNTIAGASTLRGIFTEADLILATGDVIQIIIDSGADTTVIKAGTWFKAEFVQQD